MSSLHHPNVITFYESFIEEDQLIMVMEYAAGGDLRFVTGKLHECSLLFSQKLRSLTPKEYYTASLLLTPPASSRKSNFGNIWCNSFRHRPLSSSSFTFDRVLIISTRREYSTETSSRRY